MAVGAEGRWSQAGWGYVVVMGAFMAAFLLDGMESSFGVLMPSLLDDVQGSVAMTSLTGGVVTGVALAIGPITSRLIEKYGCRPIAFAGGLTMAFSVTMATFSSNLAMFTVFYGICTGVGIGMVYMSYITVVNIYFDHKRSIAMGVVTSGSGVGILTMALLINALITSYGWRGCYWVVAAIHTHLLAIALLMRPLTPCDKSRDQPCDLADLVPRGEDSRARPEDSDAENDDEAKRQTRETELWPCPRCCSDDHATLDGIVVDHKHHSDVTCAHCSDAMGQKYAELTSWKHPEMTTRNGGLKTTTSLYFSSEPFHEDQGEGVHGFQPNGKSIPQSPGAGNGTGNENGTALDGFDHDHVQIRLWLSEPQISLNGTLRKQDLVFMPSECMSTCHPSLTSFEVRGHKKTPSHRSSHVSLTNQKQDPTVAPQAEGQRASYRSLLTDPVFLLFCYGAFSFQLAFGITPMFTPTYGLDLGMNPRQAASTVSVLGICNMIGRFLAGALSYLGLGSLRVYVMGTVLAGLVCLLIPWCVTFPALLLFAATHGFFIGVFFPLQSVILVEILGIEQLPRSFGILCACRSTACMLGPFMAGALYEVTRDSTAPFLLAGAVTLVASTLQIVMAVLLQRCRRRPSIKDRRGQALSLAS